MPDGPPFIQSVVESDVQWSMLRDFAGKGYHLTLDENRRWSIQISYANPPGNTDVFVATFVKPKFPNNEEFGISPVDFKFDNEDIYVCVRLDDQSLCAQRTCQRDPSPIGNWASMTWGSPGGAVCEVRIDCTA